MSLNALITNKDATAALTHTWSSASSGMADYYGWSQSSRLQEKNPSCSSEEEADGWSRLGLTEL